MVDLNYGADSASLYEFWTADQCLVDVCHIMLSLYDIVFLMLLLPFSSNANTSSSSRTVFRNRFVYCTVTPVWNNQFDSDLILILFICFATDSSLLRISSPTSDSEPLSLSSLDSNSRVQGTMRSPSPRLIQKESPPQSDTKREHRRGTATRTRPPPAPSENHDDPRSSPRRHSTTKVNSVMKYVSESRTECSIK